MPEPNTTELVGEGHGFESIRGFIRRVAATTTPALLLGEPGTGKEVIARAIHSSSRRRSHPFVTVDPSLYYEQELERELFGLADPATGAAERRGLLELSPRGTCFIANAEELSIAGQERLLEYVLTGKFRRVGARRPVPSRVRVVLGSGKNLRGFAESGLFLRELFDRCARDVLEVPALRDRPDDILPFVREITRSWSIAQLGEPDAIRFTEDSLEALQKYVWPGNYDELKAELLSMFRSGVRTVTRDSLAPEILHYWLGAQGVPQIRRVIEEIENYIEEFRIMVRLDAEYGEVLLGSGEWETELKCYDRV